MQTPPEAADPTLGGFTESWRAIGRRITEATGAKYDVVRELGRGGMGIVLMARDRELERQVAIKVLAPGLMGDDSMVARLQREARTIPSLRHESIISVYEVGRAGNLHFFVMDFIEGVSLGRILRAHGPFPIPVVEVLLLQIGSALAYAHERTAQRPHPDRALHTRADLGELNRQVPEDVVEEEVRCRIPAGDGEAGVAEGRLSLPSPFALFPLEPESTAMQTTAPGRLAGPATVAALAALVLVLSPAGQAAAQLAHAVPDPGPVETRRFGELAEGPYDTLLIRNVMVVPGHGGPGQGPMDIVVTGNVIASIDGHDPERDVRADRVIEGDGDTWVTAGLTNLHLHLRGDELPLDYIFYLQLATGVTGVGPAEEGRVADILGEVWNNEILAPRLYPLYGWGSKTDYTEEQLRDPAMADRIAEEMVANGVRQVYINGLTWSPEYFGMVAQAVERAGGKTAVHIQPSNTSVVNALDAARLGVSMIVHHYGYAESALDRGVQNFPSDYSYQDENKRFREAARVWHEVGTNPEARHRLLNTLVDSLVHFGVVMQPNRATYEANRDIMRAHGLPWHEKYTHQALWDWHLPHPHHHASFQYDWSSMDEFYWTYMYDLWAKMIYEFNARGGTVVYGTDDNYQWSTGGFGNIRELQLVLESGMHPLEVLRTAQLNSARFIGEPHLGMVREGFVADLIVVDGNPVEDFKTLYPFGTIRMDPETEEMYRTKGILHTIKDGIVIENDRMMEEVARIVAESKEGVGPDIVTEPFQVRPRATSNGGAGGGGEGGRD